MLVSLAVVLQHICGPHLSIDTSDSSRFEGSKCKSYGDESIFAFKDIELSMSVSLAPSVYRSLPLGLVDAAVCDCGLVNIQFQVKWCQAPECSIISLQ